MHQRTMVITVIGMFLIIPNGLLAQPPGSLDASAKGRFLGLEQAIETALQSHPIVLEGNASLQASSARVDQTKSLYYPQVYANADGAAGSARINPRFVTPAGAMLQPNLSSYTAGVLASQ